MVMGQVMGAPVAGSDVRAYVMTGGGLRLKHLRPSMRSRRVQMIFPLTGTERRGLVSLEAKKRKVAPTCIRSVFTCRCTHSSLLRRHDIWTIYQSCLLGNFCVQQGAHFQAHPFRSEHLPYIRRHASAWLHRKCNACSAHASALPLCTAVVSM